MAENVPPKKLTINPVTRIEGHSRITLQLDDAGKVASARFHVNEFRGFEKFCEGRLFTEMPTITPRICGICPVSHAVASAMACERIMRVEIPPTAHLLRRLIQCGQLISSHALSFFHLSSPDMLLGWDSDPATRNILGVAAKFPDLAKRGIRLRKFGQEISERITGKKVHSIGITAGGMTAPLKEDDRRALLDWMPEVFETTRIALDIFKKYRDEHEQEIQEFANFPSPYLGLVGPNGSHEIYSGNLRFVGADGTVLADQVSPDRYREFIAEESVSWSYLKYPYYKPLGQPAGHYRVGPLARLNVADRMRTPQAQSEFVDFKTRSANKLVHGSFFFHQARLIEMLAALEEVQLILSSKSATSPEILAKAGRNQAEGVGCTEAPRGILFHHYTTDEGGVLSKVNLLIATGQNNPAMNQSILEVARRYVDGKNLKEGALNRVEGAIRCYDPCLSCSTHAVGTMPLIVEIIAHDGTLLNEIRRA